VNLVPSQYRNVSVADVPVALDEESLRGHLLGRPVYRRTRYVVARHGDASAVIEVSKESELPLFSPVVEMSVLAGPDETAFVDAPETDTAVPTQLARVAAQQAPGARCVIVRGRYGHVSFILDPAPIRIGVVEVVPPWPPKLADQLSRVLELAEDLPPVELVLYLVDLDALAATSPAEHYLFPCRAGQPSQDQPSAGRDGSVSYLDEIPERVPWTLVGCARSKSIHDWFYGGDVPMVDMCPRRLAENGSALTGSGVALTGNGSALTGNGSAPTGNGLRPGSLPVITKCCLLEDRVGQEAGLVVVPWGASLAQIREGLRLALNAGRSANPVPR
jgi:hypothetical protein